MPGFLGVSEVATMLRVPADTVCGLIHDGYLGTVRSARAVLIPEGSLWKFLEGAGLRHADAWPVFLLPCEVTDLLGVSRSTVIRRIHSRELTAIRIRPVHGDFRVVRESAEKILGHAAKVLTVREVARILRVNRNLVMALKADGRLEADDRGRITEHAVRRYLAGAGFPPGSDWPVFLLVSEITAILSVSQETVRHLVRAGHLTAMATPGGNLRITEESLEHYVRNAGVHSRHIPGEGAL